uniref:WAT1-related protein At5g40240-like n=1 Tax=Erigeron canadensis TaxID=72917 RepID=UPI001CB92432|nr:WAT1-related protein At5g40240-like [Erigeron canadensis]
MAIHSKTWSWIDEVLPFVTMLIVIILDVVALTIVKAAMNAGMKSIVYIVYHNALGTLILLPFFIVHIFRDVERPPLSFRILFRFFILGLLGICLLQVLVYAGIYYSSPTLASAITNLVPANIFLLAVIVRMEKVDIRSSSGLAKLFGTIIAISGAMVCTFYQGPIIFQTIPSRDPSNQLVLSQPSSWVYGGLILFVGVIVASVWNVIQTATARVFPDQQTVVFFFSLFGTIQCIALSPFLERTPSAWVLYNRIEATSVVFGAVFSNAIRFNVVTWCLKKRGPVFVSMFSPIQILVAVIMGVTFLGDSLHLGSAIGAVIVATGFYSVMWGQAKEKNKANKDLDVTDEHGSSNQNSPLLSSVN